MGIEIGVILIIALGGMIAALAAYERDQNRRKEVDAIDRTARQTRQQIDQLCEQHLRQEYEAARRRLSR